MGYMPQPAAPRGVDSTGRVLQPLDRNGKASKDEFKKMEKPGQVRLVRNLRMSDPFFLRLDTHQDSVHSADTMIPLGTPRGAHIDLSGK